MGVLRTMIVIVLDMLMAVVVFDDNGAAGGSVADLAHASERAVDHQHPSTTQPEVTAFASEFKQNPRAECNKGHPNDLAHPVVEPVGDSQAERNRDRSKHKHDESMAERVNHREQETTPSTLGGATEVGNGSDVVPVEAMAQAKSERCQQ